MAIYGHPPAPPLKSPVIAKFGFGWVARLKKKERAGPTRVPFPLYTTGLTLQPTQHSEILSRNRKPRLKRRQASQDLFHQPFQPQLGRFNFRDVLNHLRDFFGINPERH